MIAKRAKQSLCAIVGLFSLVVTLYSLVKFILFISKPMERVKSGDSEEWKVAVRHLLHNSIFIVVFILQHSFQRHPNVKLFWEKIGLKIAERSTYNLVSALILLVSFSLYIFLAVFCIIASSDASTAWNSIASFYCSRTMAAWCCCSTSSEKILISISLFHDVVASACTPRPIIAIDTVMDYRWTLDIVAH